MTLINRRGILMGLASAIAAPAIVHAGNLMPVKRMVPLFDEVDSSTDRTAAQIAYRMLIEFGVDSADIDIASFAALDGLNSSTCYGQGGYFLG